MKLWRTGLADLTGLVLATGLLPAPAPAGAQSPTLAPAKGGPVPVNRPPRQAAKVAAPAAVAALRTRAARELLEANLPPADIVPLCLPYLQPPSQNTPGKNTPGKNTPGKNTPDAQAQTQALRVLAIDTLARCGARASAALPQLFGLVANRAEPAAVRQAALRTLAALRPAIPLLVPTLVGALADSSLPPATRIAVLEGLGQLGPAARDAAAPALVRALGHADTGVQCAAYTALGRVSLPPSIPVGSWVPPRPAPGALNKHLAQLDRLSEAPAAASARAFMALQAAAAAGSNAPPAAAAARLLAIAQQGPKPFHRVAALQTLERIRPPVTQEATAVLLSALADADAVVGEAAAPVVARLVPDGTVVVGQLVAILGHKTARVRHAAARALLGRRPGVERPDLPAGIVPALARAIALADSNTPPEHLRACARLVDTLVEERSKRHTASVAGALLAQLRPGSPLLSNPAATRQLGRAYLLGALARLGVPAGSEPAALDAARAGLNRSNTGYVFAAAARLAGALGPAGAPAVSQLLGALEVDFADAFVDRVFHPVAPAEALHGNGAATTSSARREAVRALGQIGAGAASAVSALRGLAQEQDPARNRNSRDKASQELAIELAQALEAIGDVPLASPVTSAPLAAGSAVRVGQPVPAFALTDLEGATHGPESWRGRVALLVFVDAACPCVPAYDARMKALHARFSTQGLHIVYVFAGAADTTASVRRFATARSYPWISAHDAGGQPVARLFGARVTTEVCLVDKNGVLRYRGRIDDNIFDAQAVKHRPLAAALESVLAGRPVLKPETTAFGCALELAPAPPSATGG